MVQSGKLDLMTARTLILLRHAKADRPDGTADIDRPLTDRGHADAAAAGAWLVTQGQVPDLVICSPAKRTRQTWHGVAVALAGTRTAASPTVHYERRAYDGGAADLLTLVREAGDGVRVLLLIGHNPAVSLLAAMLDPTGETGDSDGLRTAGLAVHDVPGGWAQVGPGQARLAVTHTARS